MASDGSSTSGSSRGPAPARAELSPTERLYRGSPSSKTRCVIMCHDYTGRPWHRETTEREADEDETPEFLTDEEVEDAEVLTDGGDEE